MQRWHLSVCAWMPPLFSATLPSKLPKKNLDQLALVGKKHVSSKRWAVKISKPQKKMFRWSRCSLTVSVQLPSPPQKKSNASFKKNSSSAPPSKKKTKKELQPYVTNFIFKKTSATTVVFLRSPSPSVAAGASGPSELPEPKVMAADLGPERSFHGRPEMVPWET